MIAGFQLLGVGTVVDENLAFDGLHIRLAHTDGKTGSGTRWP